MHESELQDEADVVVVGFGAAGLSAAIAAHDAGSKVLVLEKTPEPLAGGNSRVSGQVWFSPTDPQMARLHLRQLAGEFPIPESTIAAWAEETARNNQWMQERVKEVRGRVVWDTDDPYAGDGTDIARLSWGGVRASVGTSVASDYEFPELEGNECGTEYNMIGGSMGFSRAWLTLRSCLEKRGVPVRFSTRAVGLLRGSNGEIVGVAAKNADDDDVIVRAHRGVVMASGGFANNSAMARNFIRLSYVTPWGSPACTGDGIVMAQKVGADLAHPYNYMAQPGIAMPPYESGEAAAPSGGRFITVGADGRRFMDETCSPRHGKSRLRGGFDFHPAFPMWTIFDEEARLAGPLVQPRSQYAVGWSKLVERYEWSADNEAEIERGWITCAESLSKLAAELEIDPQGLESEVHRFNSWIDAGIDDPVYGRPASTMSPIARPPFYGFRWAQLMITTLGGIRKDERARVLDPDGMPIPRLYCAGDVGSTYSWCLSGGMALGDALAFGRIAGNDASGLAREQMR